MCPIVVVSCFNQLALLELQAQSISKHLKGKHDIFIIVNEIDTAPWDSYFKEKIEHYYANHNLHVMHVSDFDIQESPKLRTAGYKWVGWDVQQILKLAISEHITDIGYLVLDCQNFLIREFSTQDYIFDGRLPHRQGHMVMPMDTWNAYNNALSPKILYRNNLLSICTPIFLSTSIVNSLINTKESLFEFSAWFNSVSKIKSEFMLYDIWMKKSKQTDKHYYLAERNDWANPYLRDSHEFNEQYAQYMQQLGAHEPHKWTSINYRAWGDLSEHQYAELKTKLAEFNLDPAMDNFRLTYNQT